MARRLLYPLVTAALAGAAFIVAVFFFFAQMWLAWWPDYVSLVAPLVCAWWAGISVRPKSWLGAIVGSSAILIAVVGELVTAVLIFEIPADELTESIDWYFVGYQLGFGLPLGAIAGIVGAHVWRSSNANASAT